MKIIHSTGKINTEGRSSFGHQIPVTVPNSVRVIVLFKEMEAELDHTDYYS
jgi:hypothetical protein